ncbi:MAG TPA: hypothetical protein VFB29_10910, partial [Pseudolabrys sp.]|nr:hypothetical protein [Pseudolabrys sp.]
FPLPGYLAGQLDCFFGGSFLTQRSAAVATSFRAKPSRNRVVISTRDLARRMRKRLNTATKRLNDATEEIELAVAKVGNNAKPATEEPEVKRT